MSSSSRENSPDSDNEIFMGKLSLKEVRRHLFSEKRNTISVQTIHVEDEINDTSLKIIETCSEPDLLSDAHITLVDSPSQLETLETSDICELPEDDSFIKMEQMVSNLSFVEKIKIKEPVEAFLTPEKENIKLEKEIFATPTADLKPQTPIFKTPANPGPSKKLLSSTKKTPLRSNAYEHITSPIASYIKNSPQVPLIKDIRPKKPLVSSSSIPTLMKPPASVGKENFVLPALAYKSAKETKTINLPSEKKLPESQWAKKVASSIPKPVVIRHMSRENNLTKKYLSSGSENSFADLSLQQADLSVCIQKSARPQN